MAFDFFNNLRNCESSADAAYQAGANGEQFRGFNRFSHMHLVTGAKDTLAVLRPDKRGERQPPFRFVCDHGYGLNLFANRHRLRTTRRLYDNTNTPVGMSSCSSEVAWYGFEFPRTSGNSSLPHFSPLTSHAPLFSVIHCAHEDIACALARSGNGFRGS